MTMTGAVPQLEPQLGRRDPRFVTAMVAVLSLGALMAITAELSWGARMALSVGAGAAIAASNLYVLSRIVGAMIAGGAGAGAWGVIAFMKMLILFGGIWMMMTRGLVDPMGLLAGYGSLPIGIVIGSIVSDKASPGT
jgi:hypothetical protein